MQQPEQQGVTADIVQISRRLCAIEILGGDAESSPQQLIQQRLTDARFSPPEIWQQAADALSQCEPNNEPQTTAFEEQAVCRAIEEFSRQYFLLTAEARRNRLNTLLKASTNFAALHWRVQRLSSAVEFQPAALKDLTVIQRKTALQLCRLFALPIGLAAAESREICRSICSTKNGSLEFKNIVVDLRYIPGWEDMIAQTGLEKKVHERSQRRRSGSGQPMTQQALQRAAKRKPTAPIPWKGLLVGVIVMIGILGRVATMDPFRPDTAYSSYNYRSTATSTPASTEAVSVFVPEIEQKTKPSYTSSRFPERLSTPSVFANERHRELRSLLREKVRSRLEKTSASQTPWNSGHLLRIINEALPDVASPKLLTEQPASPKPNPKPFEQPSDDTNALRIIQRHLETERLLQQLQPEPLPELTPEYRSPFRRPIRIPTPTPTEFGDAHVPELPGLPALDSSLFSLQTGSDD